MSEVARRISACTPHQVAKRASVGAVDPQSPPSSTPNGPITPLYTLNTPSCIPHPAFRLPSPSLASSIPSPSLHASGVQQTSPQQLSSSPLIHHPSSSSSSFPSPYPFPSPSPLSFPSPSPSSFPSPSPSSSPSPFPLPFQPKRLSLTPTPVSGKPGPISSRRASYDLPGTPPTHPRSGGKRFSLDVSWLLSTTTTHDHGPSSVPPSAGQTLPSQSLHSSPLPPPPFLSPPQHPQPFLSPSPPCQPHLPPSLQKLLPSPPKIFSFTPSRICPSHSSPYQSSPTRPLQHSTSHPLNSSLSLPLQRSPSLPPHLDHKREHDKDEEDEKVKRKRSLQVPRITLDVADTTPPSSVVAALDADHITSLNNLSAHHSRCPTHPKRKSHSISGYHRRLSSVSSVWEGGRRDSGVWEGGRKESGERRRISVPIPPRRASWHALTFSPAARSFFPHAGVFTPSSRDHTFRYSPVFPFSNLRPGPTHRTPRLSPRLGSPFPCQPPPLGATLGRGGFGTVKVGSYRGTKVAVKVLRGRRAASTCAREALALPLPPCPYLLSLLAVVTPAPPCHRIARVEWGAEQRGKDQLLPLSTVASIFRLPLGDFSGPDDEGEGEGEGGQGWGLVVSEVCSPLTLLSLINDVSLPLPITTKLRFLHELASGVSFLHSHGLVHLDVKPANALLTHQGRLRLGDFGCCKDMRGDEEDPVVGTVVYQAPEVLRGDGRGCASDVFSLGITTWHLLTRTCPYPHLHPHVVIYQVVRLGLRPPDHHPPISPSTYLDALLFNLAVRCWAEFPEARPTAVSLCRTLAIMRLAGPSSSKDLERNLRLTCTRN